MGLVIYKNLKDPFGRNSFLVEGVSDGVKFSSTVDNAPPRVWGIIVEAPENKTKFDLVEAKKRIQQEVHSKYFGKDKSNE